MKSYSYIVLGFAEHYNFDIGYVSILGHRKIQKKKLIFKI